VENFVIVNKVWAAVIERKDLHIYVGIDTRVPIAQLDYLVFEGVD